MSDDGSGAAATSASPRPAPPESAKVSRPTSLSRRGVVHTLRSAFDEFQRDQCTDLAAALTYFSVLSVAPALLALFSLLGVVGRGDLVVREIITILGRLGQADVAQQLRGPLEGMVSSGAASFTLVLGVLTALFSASGYVGAFGRALNRVYGVQEGRPIWKLRPVNVAVTFGLVLAAALVLLGLVLSGGVAETIGSRIGLGTQTVLVWNVVKWPVILLIVMGMVATLYYVTPNVRQPGFRWISPGAVVAIVVWILASVGFGFYVGNFGSYNATYGTLGGIIVLLLWLWLTNIALLLGAEIDAELERVRELASGIRAERRVQLEPRDTTQSDKAAEKLQERIVEGRAIRRAAVAENGVPARRRRAGRHRARPGEAGAVAPPDLEPLPSEVAAERASATPWR
ncbi:YihY/virulence factor BrkB family protein [Phycicoccus sp. BSK3Z-2]|uniref:YihY/virulence factor BrkB family protein n=1 Tax=Phycicoccus avicenniae TaxID=2828860 RepID=A0A941D4D3_9MICO|nr:YihY/virulence factor BrkB family protein [Phycicoccus avicenniae]MBR7741884.1 YihY/virulence factor BrkB family protein [Phycicoccus avicenniae]